MIIIVSWTNDGHAVAGINVFGTKARQYDNQLLMTGINKTKRSIY